MSNSTPLVPRNAYTQAILKELNAVPYTPEHHNGMRNPYSHKRIASQSDYEEYVREYVYYRLCDELIAKKYAEQLAQNTRQLEAKQQREVRQLNARHHETVIALNVQHDKELKRVRWRWPILAVFLILALVCVFAWYIPSKQTASYNSGHKDGYSEGTDEGYTQGYVAGYAEGAQENDAPSAGDSSRDATHPKLGVSLTRTVYVSRNNIIHKRSNCSGMRYYTEMTYSDACAAGYGHCSRCF